MPDALGRYIARATQPLPPLTDLEAAHEALSALTNIVGAARIVAIGESFHHTHEQLVIREHLVRHLVSRLGFNVIMLEVINPGPNAIDYFVRGGAGDAEDALIKAGARMWRNRKRRRSCAGFARTTPPKAKTAPCAPDVLRRGLWRAVADQIATADAQRVNDLSSGFNIDGRADQTAYNQLSADERALLRRVFSEANATFSSRANSFERDLGATAYEIVREQALVVTQAIEMLEAGARGWTEGFALRDAAMADAMTRQIARARADDKFIILSHNMHIAAVAPVGSLSHAPMGEHLKRRFGDAYFSSAPRSAARNSISRFTASAISPARPARPIIISRRLATRPP